MPNSMMRTCSLAFLIASLLLVSLSIALPVAASVPANNERTAPQLYRRYCASCHGPDGRSKTSKGKFSHARDLTDTQWQDDVTDERVFNSIMNGRNVRGNMPAFSKKLNEKEAESLVSFVRKFKG
jgi:mono/diheme cytochrome c family protein